MLVIPKAGAVGYAAKGVAGAVTRNLSFRRHGMFGGENKQSCYTTGLFPGNSLCPFWDGENVTLSKIK